MEIVDPEIHRVLSYIDALNKHGQKPQSELVDGFADAPDRKYLRESGILALAQMRRQIATLGERTTAAETVCQYLARLGWICSEGKVELTPIGRALLKSLNAPALEDATVDVVEVVLSPENPFAYVQALNALASVEDALLVEPYFRLQQLIDIAELDNITRVLLSNRVGQREIGLLASGIATLDKDRAIEIRTATDLHDRYLIPSEEGMAMMLGASLGGIGRKVSTLTTLGEVASHAIREAHEEIWKSAELVEPKAVTTASTEDKGTSKGRPSGKTDQPSK